MYDSQIMSLMTKGVVAGIGMSLGLSDTQIDQVYRSLTTHSHSISYSSPSALIKDIENVSVSLGYIEPRNKKVEMLRKRIRREDSK